MAMLGLGEGRRRDFGELQLDGQAKFRLDWIARKRQTERARESWCERVCERVKVFGFGKAQKNTRVC